MGTLEHSVLGTRYVYDACADPVFVATLLDTIRTGGRQADLHLRTADGTETVREPTATARGEGAPTVPTHDPGVPVSPTDTTDHTVIDGPGWTLTVMRRLGPATQSPAPQGSALIGSFDGGTDLRLAVVSRRS